MNTHQPRPSDENAIARRVLIIHKEKTAPPIFARLAGSSGSRGDTGWEFVYADRLEDAPGRAGGGPLFLHCVDAAYREDDIRAYVTRLKSADAAHTVIAFCPDSDRRRRRALLAHGVYDCVALPLDPDELQNALERSHERARLARSNALKTAETAALEEAIVSVIASTKRLAKHLSLEDFCRALMQELASLFGAAGGSFYVVDGARLVRVYALDPGHAPDEIELPLAEESFLGLAHKTGRPVLASDIVRERNAVPSGFDGYKGGSCLILPLFFNGEELVAFISLHDTQARTFNRRDRTIGTTLAAVSSGFLRALRSLADARERESRYEHFFKEGLTINFVARTDGRITLANPAFYRAFGTEPSREAGLSLVPFFVRKNEWPALLGRLALENAIDNFETEIVVPGGERRLLFGNLVANAGARGDLQSVSGVFFDITQKKLLEQERHHSLKMEAIGRLAGGVAHDFNNLITAILGYCEVVKDRMTDRAMAEEIEGIRRAGEKAAALTRQLLSLARKGPVAPAPLRLTRLMRELDRLLSRVIGEDIELTASYTDTDPVILADRGELEQVIINLIVNARDAMPRGGRIQVAVTEEEVVAEEGEPDRLPGPYVVLRVTDEGVGMDEETMRRAFEPFFSTKEKGKGTGLGLSTVYGIVKQAGGFVKVTSAPGAGSTFALHFPQAAAEGEEPAAAPVAAGACLGTERILLVDDEKIVREVTARVLANFGYSVCEAADAVQALERARAAASPFACAIIDLVMPGMSGADLAAELRKIVPRLKVLFVSGYAPADLGKHGGAGIPESDFVTKPFLTEDLARKVRELISRKD